jgi:hypothetical protein
LPMLPARIPTSAREAHERNKRERERERERESRLPRGVVPNERSCG